MQCQHRHAHLDDVLDALGHRVVDVEQFHVEEDLLAACRQIAGELEAAGKHQLVADLVEDHVVTKRGDDLFGLSDCRKVQADDQSVACGLGHVAVTPARIPSGSSRM
ncbi:hypothetical protein D9M72_635300 [compost metagenome]